MPICRISTLQVSWVWGPFLLKQFDEAIAVGDESARAPREALIWRLHKLARGREPAACEARSMLRSFRLSIPHY